MWRGKEMMWPDRQQVFSIGFFLGAMSISILMIFIQRQEDPRAYYFGKPLNQPEICRVWRQSTQKYKMMPCDMNIWKEVIGNE